MLPEGTYDALVVDAEPVAPPPGTGADRTWARVDLTVTAGTHKGEVVTVTGPVPTPDPLDLLGVPATITVVEGRPRIRFEP